MTMSDQELKADLLKIVLEFTSKRNEAENYVWEQSDAQEKAIPADDYTTERVDWHHEFSKLLVPLFNTYCTDKRRVYGGTNGYAFGTPVTFDGVENAVSTAVELKNKSRAEVYIKTNTRCQDEYLFVLLRKADAWKIDNYKGRRYGEEKWENQIL
jgi:hypothetical protein